MQTTIHFPFKTKGLILIFISHGLLTAATPASTISGRVLDKESGRSLHGANVLVEELGVGTASDALGIYTLGNIPDGEYTISASMIGYSVSKTRVVVPTELPTDFLLTPTVLPGQEIVVTGDRARRRETPFPFTDVTRDQIEERWAVRDVPMLLEMVPGVYSYSDAGNGIGYTHLKIRGFDQRRVNVSIDGVPLNDPEDHNVYWVDIPNLLSNVEDIQVQRGIGTSLYGRNAFGGSVNLVTSNFPAKRRFGLEVGMGSYDTKKYSLDFLSGLIDNTYSFYGRFSRITTDGYRHDAWSELWSYFLSATRYNLNSSLKINVYGGPERSHAAWDASPESALKQDHRHNPYSYYDNETDNFNQPHYELHHEWKVSDNLVLRNTLFYIHGEGYYEQLKYTRKLKDYSIDELRTQNATLFGADSLEYYAGIDLDGDWENDILALEDGRYTLKRTDLVRQKWVIKDQYGWVPTLRWEFAKGVVSLGGELSTFASDHFGKVLWAKYVSRTRNPEDPYYQYKGEKFWVSPFIHVLYRPLPQLVLTGELQYQYKTYAFMQHEAGNFVGELRNAYEVAYHFVNPRLGVNYNVSPSLNVFGYVGVASREPSDDDLFDVWDGPDDLEVAPLFATPDTVWSGGEVAHIKWRDPRTKSERLVDLELGAGYANDLFTVDATSYYMLFTNEIVPYGGVDDEGGPITGNADETIHRGLELEATLELPLNLTLAGNLSASQNYYQKFIYHDWDGEKDYSKNSIPLFPRYMANFWISYRYQTLSASISLRSVGKQFLDNTHDETRIVDPYSVVGLDLSWESGRLWGLQGLKIHLKINNLLDEKYETSGYWYGERYLYPAAGRNYIAILSTSL